MKKRNLALMTAALVLALTACGGGSSSETKVSGETDKAETSKADEGKSEKKSEEKKSSAGKELRLVNGKIEVDAQLKELAAAYEKETGVKVNIESMGGGIDIQGTLKGYFQADNMPDIFVNGGDTDF